MNHRPPRFTRPCLIAWTFAASFATAAHAGTYIVGIGNGCTHSTIQSALDAAVVNAPSTVRITRSATWSAQKLRINGTADTRDITLEGGYATCAQTTNDGTYTQISGAGASGSVLGIFGKENVQLRYLTIRDGSGSTYGGGIYMGGNGNLTLQDTTIQYNRADYGGGIYVDRVSSFLPTLVLNRNVLILNNTANTDGGGIYLRNTNLNLNGPNSMLFGNTAGSGYGGGLMIYSTNYSATAIIDSTSVGALGAINGNSARYGGGVAIVGASNTTTPQTAELVVRDTAIRANSASTYGGAIYARSFEGTGGGNIASAARLSHVEITGNDAPYGAAVFLDRHAQPSGNGIGARLEIDYNLSSVPESCIGDYCSRITGNQSSTSPIIVNNQGTVQIGSGVGANSLSRTGVLVSGNTGPLVGGSNDCLFYLNNVQITANTSSPPIIGGACQFMEMNDVTIAGNNINNANVIAVNGDFIMRRSIVWQPGKTTLGAGTGGRAFVDIVTSESASLTATGAQRVLQADPWFIDPAHGDYGLQAASPAVDFGPAVNGDDRDAQGRPRDVDFPIKVNTYGPRDLGALERQDLAPLVLGGDFDFSDLRLWTRFNGEWDSTQNAVGGNGSGSWKFSASGTDPRVYLGEQCVHLPGPARYRINGYGKSSGITIPLRDYAILGWEFRRNGTASCNGGAANASGELYLGSSTSWTRPAQPATVDVSAQDWTANSSITLRLIGEDAGVVAPRAISVWFDGITMEAVPLNDLIFANGFE